MVREGGVGGRLQVREDEGEGTAVEGGDVGYPFCLDNVTLKRLTLDLSC